ncbi:F-box/LRR-repeat protein 20-like isoform X1 [Penaeus chinensis]|uniref:F-box/LRR-repeat protein 20-like isoform X1 n=1 Tax=Penaeus chinensis TaxID=139456 RepID=UPI001FB60D81|nr:F-box/LRR-repeat protein 20-like isoform X1 [Penaeus chinensis]
MLFYLFIYLFIYLYLLQVSDKDLYNVLSSYVPVINAFTVKDKITKRNKGFGFATVRTKEDADTLLNLKGSELYLYGFEMKIRPAWKKIRMPGDEKYVRHTLSDRDFDLSPPNPDAPSIHILVDDVLIHILEYLQLTEIISCERVCRRWQMLIYGMFAKSSLELSPTKLNLFGPLTHSVVSKLLILSGSQLKELRVKNVDYATRSNILKVVGQLCPELECLDVSMVRGINFRRMKELTSKCTKLKSLVVAKCPDFDEKALCTVLESYPDLECLNVSCCPIYGRCFKKLPVTLKELKISYCQTVESLSQEEIGIRCPNLEVLHMDHLLTSRHVLESIGRNCSNLKDLTVTLCEENALSELPDFTNLKSLRIECTGVDLTKLMECLPSLENLNINALDCVDEPDFSILKELRALALHGLNLSESSLGSLENCPHLESGVPNELQGGSDPGHVVTHNS